MKKQNGCTMLLAVLTAVFLAVGGWLLVEHKNTVKNYEAAITEAEQALAGLDLASAEAAEAALAAKVGENQMLEQEIAALQTENDTLDADTAALQESNSQLQQQEDTIYYQTILESLREGMSQLGQYLDKGE